MANDARQKQFEQEMAQRESQVIAFMGRIADQFERLNDVLENLNELAIALALDDDDKLINWAEKQSASTTPTPPNDGERIGYPF